MDRERVLREEKQWGKDFQTDAWFVVLNFITVGLEIYDLKRIRKESYFQEYP